MTIYGALPRLKAVRAPGRPVHKRVRPGRASVMGAAALALAVSACEGTQPRRVPPPEPVVMMPAPAPEPVAPAPPPRRKPAPPKPAARAPAPVQEPPVDAAVIGQVIGMSQDDLRAALGEPTERIDQGPGQAWIYKTPKCTVEVLFFLDVTRNGYYALDRKISGTTIQGSGAPGSNEVPERACYSEIQNARHR